MDVVEFFFPFLKWVFNPDDLLAAALGILGYLVGAVGYVFDWTGNPELAAEFHGFGAKLGAVPVQKAYAVALYMIDPVCSAWLVNGCVSCVVLAWMIAVVLKVVVWVKSIFWTPQT